MNITLLFLGIIILIWGLLESLWTTIWVDGNSGPFTGRITTWIWKFFRLISPPKWHKFLSLAGPVILSSTVLMWVLLIWLGWTLLFFSEPSSLVVKATHSAADFTDVLWYIAYTMFTVGNGDFYPEGNLWQVLSSLVAFTGISMVTLSITYVLQVVSAVTDKRAFASEVLGIGKTPEEFVIKQWTGKDFGAMELQLNSLSGQLNKLNEQHMAFPILHYYHAAREEKSHDIAIAILDDALNIIQFGMEERYHPSKTILASAKKSIGSFLVTVEHAFIKPAPETPPATNLDKVRHHGVPVIGQKDFNQNLEKQEDRRKLILGLIRNGSWNANYRFES